MILADLDSDEASIWQLVESCAYRADLPVWSEITANSDSVLDLGCGIGRVARHLAAEGRNVVGVDRDPEMVGDLNRLTAGNEDSAVAITGDVTEIADLELGHDLFGAIIAPQQLLHIIGGQAMRARLLAGVKERLRPDGIAAFAISEFILEESQPVDLLPDVREIGDWVYASRPVAVEVDSESLTVIRLRQTVAPDGSLEESDDCITLDQMDRSSITEELEAAGFRVERTIDLPETERHIATVILIARHVGFTG